MSRPRHRDLVLRPRWLLPVCRPPLERGWLRIRRGRIVEVGTATQSPPSTATTIELDEAVVIPGLVNAHTHLEFSDRATPLEASGGLPGWIGRVIDLRRARDVDTAGERARATAVRAGLTESAAHGVTLVGEISTGVPAGGYPCEGPRLRVFREALGLAATTAAASFRAATRDLEDLRCRGMSAGVSPHAPYSVRSGLGRRLVDAARRGRLPLAMHLAESTAEEELLRSGRGAFRDLFERLGIWPGAGGPNLLPVAEWITLLARGPRGVVVHGTHLGDDDDALARLARHRDRLCVAVCPRTTRAIAGMPPPVRLFRDAGVRVAIGTDSRASNPDLGVLAECRAVVDGGLASPAEALQMATRDAAWALGFDRIAGSLAAGRPADLAILVPPAGHHDPGEAILDPATRITATLRSGGVIAGLLPGSAVP